MSLYTRTTFTIGENRFSSFHSLRLSQTIQGHHTFEILIGYDWLSQLGEGLFTAGREFLGKEISITIEPIKSSSAYKPVQFNGIVTGINTGKESDGTHGFCIVKGYSPTILLEDDPHIASFEMKSLQEIVSQAMKGASPYCSSPSIHPNTGGALKYIVQYKETTQHFLKRLAARYGEWYFYDGQKIIFGDYTPQETALTHQVDLVDFDLGLEVQPNNTRFTGYEYRRNQVVENETTAQPSGKMNQYSAHMQEVSDRLYRKTSLYKLNHGFDSAAKETVDYSTFLQKRGSQARMVVLKGTSQHTALRIGDIVSINESVFGAANHGQFVVTRLEHMCTENGLYKNTFEAIPADTAMPEINLQPLTGCEPQSAIVTDNNDPKGLGRIRARFRWQQQGSTPWIRLIAPHGGSGKGFYFVPELGEEVWVGFENGNPEAPYVMGTAYNGDAKTDYGDAQNNIKAIRTRSGHTIRLDDTDGAESITITDKNGNVIQLDTAGKNIHITALESINLNAKNINLVASENVSMDAGRNVETTAGADVKVTALDDYTLTATNISEEAHEDITQTALDAMKMRSATMSMYTTLGDIKIIGSGTTILQGNKMVKISKG
ncbi:type VI secretion system Vgr family protein [Chitinophaga sp. HK235]|uniref:type VI secretion system Vgr family protein n=1 Tax=Chitinophaga sp. HK235 TaxID=2952571 RepID=UPI001BACA478|nr:phage baseplate assembly protein V [Chitinophaga sp. HK235]